MGLQLVLSEAHLSIYIPRPVLFDYMFRTSVTFLNLLIHISFCPSCFLPVNAFHYEKHAAMRL